MLRRLAIAIAVTVLLFATAAHAGGNLIASMNGAGQFAVDRVNVGVPVGTSLETCTVTAAITAPCVVMADATSGRIEGLPVLRDPSGEAMNVRADVVVVHGTVVGETLTVRDGQGRERMRIDLHPDHGASVLNG